MSKIIEHDIIEELTRRIQSTEILIAAHRAALPQSGCVSSLPNNIRALEKLRRRLATQLFEATN